MALVEANWNPNPKQLRQFGVLCLVGFPVIVWFWGGQLSAISVSALLGAAIAVLSVLAPRMVTPIFVGLMLVTIPVGIVVGELAMLLIYWGVFLPMGLIFKLRRRDRLRTKIERNLKTYWAAKRKPKSVASYFHQS